MLAAFYRTGKIAHPHEDSRHPGRPLSVALHATGRRGRFAPRQYEAVDPAKAAATLAKIRADLEAAKKALESEGAKKPDKIVALRAANRLADLGKTLDNWFKHYDSYDPQFGWWTREPYKKLTTALEEYTKFLREKIVGFKTGEDEPIV